MSGFHIDKKGENMFLRLITLALSLFLFVSCDKDSKKGTPKQENTQSAKGRFGNGYKNTQWGMSVEAVSDALKYPIIDSSDRTAIVYDMGGKQLTCYFNENRLYNVVYKPLIDDQIAVEAIVTELSKKYGEGNKQTDMVDGNTKLPLLYIEWDDGVTNIVLSMTDPLSLPYRKIGFDASDAYHTLMISYESIDFETQKTIKSQQQDSIARENVAKSVKGDL